MVDAEIGDGPFTREEIEEWEEEHGETHPAFRVDHRPERQSVTPDGCLWGECKDDDVAVVHAHDSDGESMKTRVCSNHLEELESRTGVSVEVLR